MPWACHEGNYFLANVLSREPECEEPNRGMSYLYRATFALPTLAALQG